MLADDIEWQENFKNFDEQNFIFFLYRFRKKKCYKNRNMMYKMGNFGRFFDLFWYNADRRNYKK